MKALSISNLEKTYSNGMQALKGISFDIEEGDFFALLGPNGAGKTTTIGIITSLVNKTNGTYKVFGESNETEIKKQIGIVPQEFNFNIFEKVLDIVCTQAGYYNIPKNIALKRAKSVLEALGLWSRRNHQARTLSGGLKRRLMIARALINKPKLLILDEPTAGVDVELRYSMWEFLKKLNKNGTTIILTTHYLEEAEQLCNKIAIIDKGIIIKNTTMKNLLKKVDKESYIIETYKAIKKKKYFEIINLDNNTYEITINNKDLNKLFKENKILSIRNKVNRLEGLFMQLVKK
tara:strand:- start:356 stop:1228 length:873 start_codon:yes stop_codon:yes gene_type:complete